MTTNGVDPQGTLTQLRAFLAQAPLSVDSRLPPERELCQQLGVSRGELRKALATLEAEGQLWRHVGKGTFIGARPAESLADLSVGDQPDQSGRGDADPHPDRAGNHPTRGAERDRRRYRGNADLHGALTLRRDVAAI